MLPSCGKQDAVTVREEHTNPTHFACGFSPTSLHRPRLLRLILKGSTSPGVQNYNQQITFKAVTLKSKSLSHYIRDSVNGRS